MFRFLLLVDHFDLIILEITKTKRVGPLKLDHMLILWQMSQVNDVTCDFLGKS